MKMDIVQDRVEPEKSDAFLHSGFAQHKANPRILILSRLYVTS